MKPDKVPGIKCKNCALHVRCVSEVLFIGNADKSSFMSANNINITGAEGIYQRTTERIFIEIKSYWISQAGLLSLEPLPNWP